MSDNTDREAVERFIPVYQSGEQGCHMDHDEAQALSKSLRALLAALAAAEAHALALVAESYEVASLVPMERLARGDSTAPGNIGAAIQRLTPADAIAARDARDEQVREEALREAASHFIEQDIADEILALIEGNQTDE